MTNSLVLFTVLVSFFLSLAQGDGMAESSCANILKEFDAIRQKLRDQILKYQDTLSFFDES